MELSPFIVTTKVCSKAFANIMLLWGYLQTWGHFAHVQECVVKYI